MPRRAINKRFATELRDVIDEYFDGNMAEYARRCKTPNGTIGHYLSGKRYPTHQKLDDLLRPLTGKPEQRLLEAFVLDLIPASMKNRIKVAPPGGKATVAPVVISHDIGVDARVLSALEYLGRLGADNRAVRQMLEQTAKAMGWVG